MNRWDEIRDEMSQSRWIEERRDKMRYELRWVNQDEQMGRDKRWEMSQSMWIEEKRDGSVEVNRREERWDEMRWLSQDE